MDNARNAANGKDHGQGESSEDTNEFVHHAEAIWKQREIYGPPGFRGIFSNSYVTVCASLAALSGFCFGVDQGKCTCH